VLVTAAVQQPAELHLLGFSLQADQVVTQPWQQIAGQGVAAEGPDRTGEQGDGGPAEEPGCVAVDLAEGCRLGTFQKHTRGIQVHEQLAAGRHQGRQRDHW
jgi:hypothetical protein